MLVGQLTRLDYFLDYFFLFTINELNYKFSVVNTIIIRNINHDFYLVIIVELISPAKLFNWLQNVEDSCYITLYFSNFHILL